MRLIAQTQQAAAVSTLLYFTHIHTSVNLLPTPTARSKHKADNSGHVSDNKCACGHHCQAKWQKTTNPVATANGNIPLKRTWDMTDLKNCPEVFAQFQVHPLFHHVYLYTHIERPLFDLLWMSNWSDSSTGKTNHGSQKTGLKKW